MATYVPDEEDADAPALPARLKRDMPLVPASSIAGRALVIVIAIMTFLAAFTAGAAILVANASQGWRESVSREITVQVRPTPGRDLEAEAATAADLVRAVPSVADVHVFTKAESEQLLEPWLGTGLDLSELPVPRLVVVKLTPGAPIPDLAALRKSLVDKVPGASLDDHRLWLERLSTMANTIAILAAMIFLLVIIAMAFAVAFATRGAMSGNREIIDVLHFVGAEDRYIAAEFRRHFLRLGLEGGALGAVMAIGVFVLAGMLSSWWAATPSGDQLEALFGAFLLGWKGYTAIVVIGIAIGVVTGSMSRAIVFRHLRTLNWKRGSVVSGTDGPATSTSPPPSGACPGQARRRRRFRRRCAAAAGGLALVGGAVFVVGFLRFVDAINRFEPDRVRRAEGVVALTGGADRIADAVDLLASGHAGRLLITGVNQTTTGAEIARLTPRFRPLFACCIDLGYEALNTLGNAAETRRWAHRHRMHSLIVVTSNYHMPRALVEIGNVLPGTELTPYPVVSERQRLAPLWADPGMLRVLAVEYVKYLVAIVRTRFADPSARDEPDSAPPTRDI